MCVQCKNNSYENIWSVNSSADDGVLEFFGQECEGASYTGC